MSKTILLILMALTFIGCQKNGTHYFKPQSRDNSMSKDERDDAIEAKRNSLQDTADYARPGIKLTIMVPVPTDNVTIRADEIMETRLAQIITQNGIGAVGGDPAFVLMTKLTPIKATVTNSAPVRTLVTYNLGLYVGNLITGDIYGTMVQKISGVGYSVQEAVVNAAQNIKNTPDLQQMLKTSTEKIVQYYESNELNLRTQIGNLIQKGDYMKAYMLMASIPPEATKAYAYAAKNLSTVYSKALIQKSSDNLIAMKNAIQKSGGKYNEEVAAYYKLIPHDSPLKADADRAYNAYTAKLDKMAQDYLEHQRQLERERLSSERLLLEQNLESQKALVQQYKTKAESQSESGFSTILKGCYQLAQQKLIKLIL